jgi:phospholipase/carboxylesterase
MAGWYSTRMRAPITVVAIVLAIGSVACDDRVTMVSPPELVERVIPPRRRVEGAPPLLVMLHGIGADENDLVPIAAQLDPRFTVVSVRAPRPYHAGFAWFQIDWRPDGTIVPNVAEAHATLADLVRWLAAAPARHGTDPHRLYLLGFSQGAMMSLGVLRTTPDRLAGVIALSGRFGEQLFDVPASRDAVARVPVFVAHGTDDDVLPIANGRAVRDAFRPLVKDFTYREYPVAHGISVEEIHDVGAWLTERLDR